MLEYNAFNQPVFSLVPTEAVSILDIGCGTGAMGKALLDINPSRRITGITYSAEEKLEAEKYYQQVFLHDLNDLSLQMHDYFDVMIFSHVLEHTVHPSKILEHYVKYLERSGVVIVALPNILFYKQRLQLIKGNFQYDPQGGVMDSTHLRFFDFISAQKLLKDAGLTIEKASGIGGFPQPFTRKLFPAFASKLDKVAVNFLPGLFSSQFVLVGSKKG